MAPFQFTWTLTDSQNLVWGSPHSTSFLIKKHQQKINHSSQNAVSLHASYQCLTSELQIHPPWSCLRYWSWALWTVSLASWPTGKICWWRELEDHRRRKGLLFLALAFSLLWLLCPDTAYPAWRTCSGLNTRQSQQPPMDSFPASSTGSTTSSPANSCEVAPRNLTTPLQSPPKCHQHPEASIMACFYQHPSRRFSAC